ncbi:MAG: MFS transporter, partial [Burkholderiales bacterium]|nr:MFS transporter [Anaerolineae bacterium]
MPIPRNVRLLSWFNFWSDFRLYAPIAILYYSQIAGSYALGMSVYSVIMLSQSLCEVPTGVFSDMIGRKRTMVCGAIADVLAMFFYALAGVVGGYPVLLIGAALQGLARSFYSGNNEALLHDTLAESGQREQFQEYLGKTSSMYQTALGISAVIGSVIAALSFQIVMWLSVLPMIAALLVSLRFTEPQAFTRSEANV